MLRLTTVVANHKSRANRVGRLRCFCGVTYRFRVWLPVGRLLKRRPKTNVYLRMWTRTMDATFNRSQTTKDNNSLWPQRVRCAANLCELNLLWVERLYTVAVRPVFFFLSGPVFYLSAPTFTPSTLRNRFELLSSWVYNARDHIIIPYYDRLTAKSTLQLRYYAFALVVLRRTASTPVQDFYNIMVRSNCGRYNIIIVTTGKNTFAFQCFTTYITYYTRHYYNYYYRV